MFGHKASFIKFQNFEFRVCSLIIEFINHIKLEIEIKKMTRKFTKSSKIKQYASQNNSWIKEITSEFRNNFE